MTARPGPHAARVALAMLLVVAPACTIVHRTVGGPLPDAQGLAIGRTTKAEALAVLGPPTSVRRQFDGELLLWRRDEIRSQTLLLVPLFPIYERTRGHAESDLLALLFDREGLLAGVGDRRDIP